MTNREWRMVRRLARRVRVLEEEAKKTHIVQVVIGEDFVEASSAEQRAAMRDAIFRAVGSEGSN